MPWGGHRPPPPKSWAPPRVSFRAPGGWWAPRWPWWRYRHYYYCRWPVVFAYGGWGVGWYDPWWFGPYWWPAAGVSFDDDYEARDYAAPPRTDGEAASDWERAPWMEPKLREAFDDLAAAWTNGTIERIQAHLTATVPISIRHDWEQPEPWVLAPPVFLDLALQALDAQQDSSFRVVQAQEMERGLVWAVAEHTFTTDEGKRVEATMEMMFRRYGDAWLIEAITASPENYRWLEDGLLKDAASESTRLFDQMRRARETAPDDK